MTDAPMDAAKADDAVPTAAEPRETASPDPPVAAGESVYSVTEAARLARVSVQALRQRIQRGTVATTTLVRDRREVTGVARSELVRAYPELAEAEDLDRVLRGEPTVERERAAELEARAAELEEELQRARRGVHRLRQELAAEREARARLEGVAADQGRRLEDLDRERIRLQQRVAELDDRLVFLDGGLDDENDGALAPPLWRRGAFWVRAGVAAVVLATAFAAGGAYWSRLDARLADNSARLEAGLQRLESRLADEDSAPGESGDR